MTRPGETWPATAAERLPPIALVCLYVVPLATIPGIAWAIGVLRGGYFITLPGMGEVVPLARLAVAGILIVAVSVFSVAVLAGAFWTMSPLYGVQRNIRAAFKIAAYGTTPMWLAGAVLVSPRLALVMALALFETLYLYVNGLQELLGVTASDATELVGVAVMVLIALSIVLGAALSAWGVL